MTQGFRIGDRLEGLCSGWNAATAEGVLDVADHGSITVRLAELNDTRKLMIGDRVAFVVAADDRVRVMASNVHLVARRINNMSERKLEIGASHIGTCKTWHFSRGYGFISVASDLPDVFVHYTELEQGRELYEGDRVSFTVGIDRSKRFCARDVRLLKPVGRAEQPWAPGLTTRADSEGTVR